MDNPAEVDRRSRRSINVPLNADDYEALAEEAERNERSMAGHVRFLLGRHVESTRTATHA